MRPLSLTAGLLSLAAALPLSADTAWPAPIQALVAEGLEVHARFEAPGGLEGFAASHRGREMAVYLTPDGEHAVVGTLIDAEGNDLSAAPLDEHVRRAQETEVWQTLEESHWIRDGDPGAERILYTFTDPNCPYCARFHEQSRPWVEAGRVQLRHVMVGILEHDSPAKAAALLGAEDPARALKAHRRSDDGIAASAQPREIEEQVRANNQRFESLGLMATPTTYYRGDDGRLERVQGAPQEARLIEIMGSPRP
ncbi:Thiol:disulfide interchange protein DsbG precursor [Halomonas sp. THAF5a]|uniref:thiol:disulfide interchange protein DsbG n=1 Tax=Halomonas sp. THAF5a TaxID=2587844 RepID=UPI001267928D|nr:thiol:disulfide interchange protein DsbG [Halomonas sp. THAF5a]QFU02638.1 Thiol:disulfide interchange protein DsbG precursor [Halomonas sp. THAF5a]